MSLNHSYPDEFLVTWDEYIAYMQSKGLEPKTREELGLSAPVARTMTPQKSIQNCSTCGSLSTGWEFDGWLCNACKLAHALGWVGMPRPGGGFIFTRPSSPGGVPDPIAPEITEKLFPKLTARPKNERHPHVCPARDCGSPALILSQSVECTNVKCRNYKSPW